MGCTQSKVDGDESVARCKERKQFMKSALTARNAFAAAHSSYAMAVKNSGAALSDYGQGEFHDLRVAFSALPASSTPSTAAAAGQTASSSSAAVGTANSAVQPPVDQLPPPPPPLPADLSTEAPLQRSVSMPGLPISKSHRRKPSQDSAITEEDDPDASSDDAETDAVDSNKTATAVPPAPSSLPKPSESQLPSHTLPQGDPWEYINVFNTDHIPAPSLVQPEDVTPDREVEELVKVEAAPATAVNDAQNVGQDPVEVEKVVPEMSSPQQKPVKKPRPASGSSHHRRTGSSGGKMVAAAAQTKSFLQVLSELDDHFLKASQSAQEVSKLLEATRLHYHSNFADNRGHIDHSEKVMKVITWNRSIKGIRSDDDVKDILDDEEWETHANVLDKLLAWEKKLYDEVKAGELMKIEYQRKISLLNRKKKHGAGTESLEKIKAAVSHLHTRYIVDMQSLDSTVSEINNLRDRKLYPKLVELVDGMATMWEAMHAHHGDQHKLVAALRSCDVSLAPRETDEQHHEITIQLWRVVREWHSQFQNLVAHQKEYIRALNGWLKLNIVPIESNLREKVSSPSRAAKPAIQDLLRAWLDQLEKLPDGLAKGAIVSFAEVIHTIVLLQEDELKLKERCEETRKEFLRKKRYFEDWRRRYMEKKMAAPAREDGDGTVEASNEKDLIEERRFAVESVEVKLKSEEETYQKTYKQVREKSVGSLRNHLPELFRALSDFSFASAQMYKQLRSVHCSGREEASGR